VDVPLTGLSFPGFDVDAAAGRVDGQLHRVRMALTEHPTP
jgi:hypothetical protein